MSKSFLTSTKVSLEAVRERFLQDAFPKRLGALAANLGRISSFAKRGQNVDLLRMLVEESEYFIEWTFPETPPHLQETLVELQIRLAVWRLRIEEETIEMEGLASEFGKWSEKIFEEYLVENELK